MATKNISITENAYEILASWKKENDSFSDVIIRLGKKKSITEFAGMITQKEAKEFTSQLKKQRNRSKNRKSTLLG